MKIVATEGCTCNDLTIDGDSTMPYFFNEEKECKERLPKLKEVLFKVLDYINDNFEHKVIFSIFEDTMELFGETDEDFIYKIANYEINYDNAYNLSWIKKDSNTIKEENIIVQDIKNVFNEVNKEGDEVNFYTRINSFLHSLVCTYGEGKYVFHCDQCGDNVYDYTIKL